jgi:hypothetical protein
MGTARMSGVGRPLNPLTQMGIGVTARRRLPPTMGTLAAAVRAEGCAFAMPRQRIAAFPTRNPPLERDTLRLFKRFLGGGFRAPDG